MKTKTEMLNDLVATWQPLGEDVLSYRRAAWELSTILAMPDDYGEVTYQIWQGGCCEATSDDLNDAKNYMEDYGQDGPVELRKYGGRF